MQSGFTDDGKRYEILDAHALGRADTDLWNDRMRVQIDHRGRVGAAGFLQPNFTSYAGDLRAFYVRDDRTGSFWSAPHEPVQAEPESFSVRSGWGTSGGRSSRMASGLTYGWSCRARTMLSSGRLRVTNKSRRNRAVTLVPFFPVGVLGLLAQHSCLIRVAGRLPRHFPDYVHYPDYYKLSELRNPVFCLTDMKPAG